MISEKMSQKITSGKISLNALRCFAAAAGEESFTRAAASLYLTHGAVSRAVRLLEEELGVDLFERRNRRVFLTRNGRQLYAAVREGLGIIDAAARELGKTGPTLNVSCEPTLLMRWLIPRLPDFHAGHPDIHIQLSAGGGPVDLGQGVDLAIRRNDFAWPAHWRAALLFSERVGPVCRAADRGRMVRPDAEGRPRLAPDVVLLHSATRPDAWSNWGCLSGVPVPEASGRSFEHFYFSIQAAVAGLGMAVGPWQLVRDDCESGILAAPFGFIEDGSTYYLLAREPFEPESPAGRFHFWLKEQAQAPETLERAD